ncbi:MAG: glycosyltransferase [Acidobacteriota bacterium]
MFNSPQNILVSVIILNYNGREHLETCLTSLQDLEFPKEQLEIIVVDNGSTDGSVRFAKSRFKGIQLIDSKVNLGFSKGANLGASRARGEYLAFLNNDMRVDRNWLKLLVEAAGAGKGVACVGSTILDWDGTEAEVKGRGGDAFCLAYSPSQISEAPAPAAKGYSKAFFVSGGAALVRRQVFQELGGFDPDFFLYQEDVDLGWRLWLRGYECVLAPKSLVYHRGGASSNKLPQEYIHELSQKHTLFSVFKNLETSNLKEILPVILYVFLERSRWVPAARESLADAIYDFQSSIESLVAKRSEVQSTRVRTDDSIFDLLGHPFNFMLRMESYDTIRKQMVDCSADIVFDPNEVDSVRIAIGEWLNRAHFHYESQLTEALAESRNECGVAADRIESLAAAFGESEKIRLARDVTIREVSEYIVSLQGDLAQSERENSSLSFRLSAKTEELDKIKSSPGWRLLNRYGRFKYRYLLPAYRLFGLPLSDRNSPSPESENQVDWPETRDAELPPAQEDIPVELNACDVICFPIIDWDFRFQRPQQLMSRFADAGHRVFYINQQFQSSGPAYTVQQKQKNIYEIFLRGPQRNIYEDFLNEKARESLYASLDELRRDLLLGATIAFVQLPFWWPLVNKTRDQFAWPIVYDCMDLHAGFSNNKQIMLDQERSLLDLSDLVLVSSSFLEEQARRRNSNVLMVRNACDYDHFAMAEQQKNKRPLIGYYGAIADWFDSDLVADLAARRPDWDFTLVGSTYSADVNRISKLPNIYLPGEKPYSKIPEWLKTFDVSIIPFKRTPLTEATNPVKVYETLAAGKPLVSVPIPEVASLAPLVRLASTAEEFEKEIIAALSEDDPSLTGKRRAFAQGHTWKKRYELLTPAIRSVFPKASIIVVTFNNLELNRLCLESIYARTEWPNFEVIVIDNNSTDGTPEYLKEAEDAFPNLRVILNESNQGFAAANNIGLHHATGDYLVLLNNDTIVTRGWISTLIRHLHRDATIGLIGPVTNTVGNEAKVEVDYTELEDMPAWASRFVQEHDGQVFPITMLAMFCVAMRREVFEKVGLLDEQFGIGMFEDDDYSHRVRLKGLRLVCAADSFVHHFGQAAFKKLIENGEYHALFKENRRRYEQKWNMEWVPHQYAPLGFGPTAIASRQPEVYRAEEG